MPSVHGAATPESCGAGWQGVQAARSHVEHYLASLQTRSLAASQGGGDAPGVRRGCRSASVCSDPPANPGLCFRPCHLPAWSRAVSCMICQRDSCGSTPSSRMSDISPQRRDTQPAPPKCLCCCLRSGGRPCWRRRTCTPVCIGTFVPLDVSANTPGVLKLHRQEDVSCALAPAAGVVARPAVKEGDGAQAVSSYLDGLRSRSIAARASRKGPGAVPTLHATPAAMAAAQDAAGAPARGGQLPGAASSRTMTSFPCHPHESDSGDQLSTRHFETALSDRRPPQCSGVPSTRSLRFKTWRFMLSIQARAYTSLYSSLAVSGSPVSRAAM